MKRQKKLTKKERKALNATASAGTGAAAPPREHDHGHGHIHCVACGKHLEPDDFGEPGGPDFYRCQHGSDFAHCGEHAEQAKALVDEHDRTGRPVKTVAAWH